MSDFKLKINDREYYGWEEVNILKSMLSMSGAFVVSADDFFIGGTDKTEIKMSHAVKIDIEGQEVINGWIDSMPVRWGQDFLSMEIHGRDKTCDLIDCMHDEDITEWKSQTVEKLIKNLCDPYNITVVVDATAQTNAGNKIETYTANSGQFVYEMIAELCRDNGILPISKGDGKLTLVQATTSDFATDIIQVGVNAKAGQLLQSNQERYSNYKVKGYGIGTDEKALTDFINPVGEFADGIIERYRPYVGFAETPSNIGACINKAKWIAKIRAGMSRKQQYTVQGWTQSSGKVWDINKLVSVDDDIIGDKSTKLICEVIFDYSEEDGELTILTLVDKNTFSTSNTAIDIKSEFD